MNRTSNVSVYQEFSNIMCWWCFKVFFGVFGNLVNRFFIEALYKMRSMCCCCCRIKTDNNNTTTYFCTESAYENCEDFYKDVTREDAEDILKDKQNGTFVVRPSRNSNIGTLSIVQDARMFHLNIRLRDQDGLVALGAEKSDEKCFQDIDGLINYYISNYLVLCSKGEKIRTLLLPYNEKSTS